MFITALKRKENGWIRAQINEVTWKWYPPACLLRNSSSIIKMNKELFTPKWKANSHELPRSIWNGEKLNGEICLDAFPFESNYCISKEIRQRHRVNTQFLFQRFWQMPNQYNRWEIKKKTANRFCFVSFWHFYSKHRLWPRYRLQTLQTLQTIDVKRCGPLKHRLIM